MVQWQLCSLEQLKTSGFGRPAPRHGLQLLFWFANNCVTFAVVDTGDIMKLLSDCQPDNGFYGFHQFGNVEELLPVLYKPRKHKSTRQFAYFEVGNLNTETYPASANLPAYVRENYGLDGHCSTYNIDRIIISYQVRTRVVEMVYVTEHDMAAFGRFRPDRTYAISCELIRALQSPQLELCAFLSQMGYYDDILMVRGVEAMHYPDSAAQQTFNTVQTYHESTASREQWDDFGFFSDAFSQRLDVNMQYLSYDQILNYVANATPHNSRLEANYSDVQKRSRALRQSYWGSSYSGSDYWEQYYEALDKEAKKRKGGGGFSFLKLLLGAGALYLAAKCFSWLLRSWWDEDLSKNIFQMLPRRAPSYQRTHVMLDYVY